MDRKDRQIVRELQKNGRLTNLELAERVNLSPSPCLRRLRNLEESGVIEGYAALVAPYAGVVGATQAELGDMAQPGRPLVTLFDPRALRVTATLPQTATR